MVRILDGSSDHTCKVNMVWHSLRSTAVTNLKLFFKKNVILHTCAACFEVLHLVLYVQEVFSNFRSKPTMIKMNKTSWAYSTINVKMRCLVKFFLSNIQPINTKRTNTLYVIIMWAV